LLALVAGDRDPPRSLERRITIGCHASLSGIDYLSIDLSLIRLLSSRVNFYLSIEQTRRGIGAAGRIEVRMHGQAMRAAEGAGPVTVGMDLGYIKTVLTHAAAVHADRALC
jgi:hypothetical protein